MKYLLFCLFFIACGKSAQKCPEIALELIPCVEVIDNNTKIYLTFGQSNAANYGETTYKSKGNVYMYVKNGDCAKAADPMLGATGCGGSIWTRLGDKILEANETISNVLFVSTAVGGSAISEWSDGPYKVKLENALSLPFEFDGLLWQQGETDGANLVSTEVYKSMFMKIHANIRNFTDAPVYLAKSTRCRSLPWDQVKQAQEELVNASEGIFPGPDTDILDASFRFDGCHFSTKGLDEAAKMWLMSLGY